MVKENVAVVAADNVPSFSFFWQKKKDKKRNTDHDKRNHPTDNIICMQKRQRNWETKLPSSEETEKPTPWSRATLPRVSDAIFRLISTTFSVGSRAKERGYSVGAIGDLLDDEVTAYKHIHGRKRMGNFSEGKLQTAKNLTNKSNRTERRLPPSWEVKIKTRSERAPTTNTNKAHHDRQEVFKYRES